MSYPHTQKGEGSSHLVSFQLVYWAREGHRVGTEAEDPPEVTDVYARWLTSVSVGLLLVELQFYHLNMKEDHSELV